MENIIESFEKNEEELLYNAEQTCSVSGEKVCAERGVGDRTSMKSLWKQNSGIGVIEVVLLLVVIIALILIFKDKIIELLNAAFGTISEGAEELGV